MSNNNETNQVPARDQRIIENDVRQEGDTFVDPFWVVVYRYSWSGPDELHTNYGQFSSREAAQRSISRALRNGEFTQKDQVWACKIVL